VHRDLEITVPAEATDHLVRELGQLDGVITLSVRRGESVKPEGDVISATVLNTEADAVLQAVVESDNHGPVSISTSTVDSVIDTERHADVQRDVDEAAWEEAETAMRRHTRLTLNFFAATLGGGVVAGAGLTATSGVTEATALVAAAIIAPVFEPLARFAIAVVNRQRSMMAGALISALLGYATVIVGAVLAMLVLRAAGHGYVDEFLNSSTVHEVQYPPTVNLILSAVGAFTGVIMVAAGRFTQLAGPVVALQLLPAAATLGLALELGEGEIAARSLGRLAIDIGLVVVAGLIVFLYKHIVVHGRRRPPYP
jgi:hypothetical protein